MKIPSELVYYTGKYLKIVFAQKRNGTCPAKEFLDSIGPPDWGKLDRIIKRLADKGKIYNIQQFRKIEPQIYEIKGGSKRLAGYFKPGYFVLTHGFEKRGGGKSDKFPPSEKQKVTNIKKEFDDYCIGRD